MSKWFWLIIGLGILAAVGGGVEMVSSALESVVRTFALAIQQAEGGHPGDMNMRINNPGNITDMGRPGQNGTFTNPLSGITFPTFDTYQHGFDALCWKVRRAFTGQSHMYLPSMSISEFFETWSHDQNEARNVAETLGVTVDTTLAELIPAEG
jgi:hypothetical protein